MGPRGTCCERVVPYVTLPRPELSGQEDGLSSECGKAWVAREFWRDLDSPVIRIDCDQPSIEQSMKVASQEQSAARVVLGIFAVEVEVRGF